MRETMNEYRVTLVDGTEHKAVRMDSIDVAKDYEVDPDNPIAMIHRVRTGLDVSFPEPPTQVHFTVSVAPAAAVTAGCLATPTAHTVTADTVVIFEAIAASGFNFTGWFLDDPTTPDSTDAIAEIAVTAPTPGQTRQVEARFAPIP